MDVVGGQPHTSPRIRIAVVPFSMHERRLLVGMTADVEGLATFPGGPARPDEPLDATARHLVRHSAGQDEQYAEQLYTLNHPDHEQWEIAVSYIALFRANGLSSGASAGLTWSDVRTAALPQPVDQLILDYAMIRLRAKLGYTNIAFHLMPETFTLSELQMAYETILERALDKRNFRRRMIASRILEQTSDLRREGNHRPAALYRFAPDRDEPAYLTPPWVND
jgi:8-oxo-dGTP diphosphatase